MEPRRPRRGYTLMELVTAATLTLMACLGGMTALSATQGVNRRAATAREVAALLQRLDKAAPHCGVQRALQPQAPAITCEELGKQLQAGPVHTQGRTVVPGVAYRQDVDRSSEFPGLWQVTTLLILPEGAPLRHVSYLRP